MAFASAPTRLGALGVAGDSPGIALQFQDDPATLEAVRAFVASPG